MMMNSEAVFRLLFWIFLAGVFGVRWYFSNKARREKRPLMPDKKAIEQEGRGLFAFRFISFFVLMAVFLIYALNPAWSAFLSMPLPAWLRWAGFLIGLSSLALLAWTQAALGRYFSPQLHLQENHQLVTTGPYMRIRHPLYTALFGICIAFTLITANWLTILLTVLVIVGLTARVPREEQMMIDEFGDSYRDYMKRTGRFFPK
jgi:protein-S-isoprenylcysteine O-methyltransferase Ste14